MKPNIGISEKDLQETYKTLNIVLSNEMLLYVKTRKFHWNVCGESFMELHLLFQSQYKEIEEVVDEIAERINKLGSKTIGTMKEFIQHATIKEFPVIYPIQKEMIKELLMNHEQVITEIRKEIINSDKKGLDAGTLDFITGLMQQHETIAWKLRRYLN